MKRFILVILALAIVLSASALTKEDYYDNDEKIIANYVVVDPSLSNTQKMWDYLNTNTRYKVCFIKDADLTYWYTISVTELLNGTKITDIDTLIQTITGGTAKSEVKLIAKDYNDALFLEAIGVSK